MKKFLVLIAGFSPLLIGYGINYLVCSNPEKNVTSLIDLITLVFFLYLGVLGFIFNRLTESKIITPYICNLPAFIVLILNIYQELINKRYWTNDLGQATQLFYLPTLRASFKVTFIHTMWETYIISFILLVVTFCIGYYIKSIVKLCKNYARAN